MKPCRDCGAPTAPSARSCPKCGILNPVMQWVALPDGSHLTAREPAGAGAAAIAAPAPFARLAPAPAAAPAKVRDVFGEDRLASWAIWISLFAILDATLIGGAIGGLIAGVISIPVGAVLPTREDGRKLPTWLSFTLLGIGLVVLFSPLLLLMLVAGSR